MKFIRVILCATLLALPASSQAWIHGSPTLVVGNAQLNLGSGDLTAQLFLNLFNGAQLTFQSGNTPAAMDQNNIPVQNFSGLITGQLGSIAGTLSTTGPWVLGWKAGSSCFKINFLNSATVSSNPSAITVTNGSGSGNLSVTGLCNGAAGSITLTWNNTSTINYQLDGSYTGWNSNASGSGGFYLVRSSDLTAFNGGRFWTAEAVSFIQVLYPESLRPMAWNGYGGRLVYNWNYRKTTSSFSFLSGDYPPGTRCGGLTSFCTISVTNGALNAAAANDTPLSAWTDGEQIMGSVASAVSGVTVTGVAANSGNGNCQISVASTAGFTVGNPILIELIGGSVECNTQTTVQSVDSLTQFTIPISFVHTYTRGGNVGYQTLTITGKTGGPKVIVSNIGAPIGANFGDTLAAGNATFTYNSTLDRVIYNSGGIPNSIPIEAQVQLANLVNANFWYNFPLMASDNYVTNVANAIYSNLNSNLTAIFELDNEGWNGQFPDTHLNTELGGALGITSAFSGSGASPLPYQSLRIRQIFGNLFPTTNWASAGSRLERLYCFQAGGGGTGFITGPMEGSSLSSFGYNTSPNRPIDFINSICHAPYVGGGSAFSGQSTDAGSPSPTTYDASLLNTIISDWNASNTAGAISLIDQSIRGDALNRVQTVTASSTTFSTPLAHNFSVNDIVRFTVSGGTSYSGLTLTSPYQILSTSSSGCSGGVTCNFTAGQITNGAVGSAVNAGSAGSGTTSVGFLTNTNGLFANGTIFGVMSGAYTKYQNMTANDFSPAPAGGTPNVRWYEGALEPTPPTPQQLLNISVTDTSATVTSLSGNSVCFSSMPFAASSLFGSEVSFSSIGSLTGPSTGVNYIAVNIVGDCMEVQAIGAGSPVTIGGTPGGAVVVGNQTLATALLGWKNDPSAATTIEYYYQTFKGSASGTITTGAMPNSKAPAQLVLQGGGLYGLNSNASYVSPSVYQLYNGFAAFSNP